MLPQEGWSALYLILGQWHFLHFLPSQHTLCHRLTHEIDISGGEQSNMAVLGISYQGKTHFHPQHIPCTNTLLMDARSKSTLPIHEYPCCGICQVPTLCLCTSRGYNQPELVHSSDYAWHSEWIQVQYNHKQVCSLSQQRYVFCLHKSISLIQKQEI